MSDPQKSQNVKIAFEVTLCLILVASGFAVGFNVANGLIYNKLDDQGVRLCQESEFTENYFSSEDFVNKISYTYNNTIKK